MYYHVIIILNYYASIKLRIITAYQNIKLT